MDFAFNSLRPLLTVMDPESAHRTTIWLLKLAANNPSLMSVLARQYQQQVPNLRTELFGHQLPNPIGIAAGFDKDGVAIPALATLGFGFVEVGTVTPKPQTGNEGKRVFRLDEHQSVINRLGFNSSGLNEVVKYLHSLQTQTRPALLGINIGKNTATTNDRAVEDYQSCLEGVYPYAGYVVLNVSSPNSPGLRSLQHQSELDVLLEGLMHKRSQLAPTLNGKLVPMAIKISPDLDLDDISAVAEVALRHKIDAIIATNTTTDRSDNITHKHYNRSGGLSGKLLCNRSTEVIREIAISTHHKIPIVGVGGISNAHDAWEKLIAGATALQLYTALIFQGPGIVRTVAQGLKELAEPYAVDDFQTALKEARQDRYR